MSLGPAEDRERPERRREPRVEHVLARGSASSSRTRHRRPASVSATVSCPSGHSHKGSWCPHQICREMFQSGAFSSESIANRCCDSGWYWTRRARSASSAGFFSSSIEHHHWSEIVGSIRVSQRSQRATVWRYASRLTSRPRSLVQSRMRSSASSCVRPASSPAFSFIRPSGPITDGSGRPWSRPMSKSSRVVRRRHLEGAGPELDVHSLVSDHRDRALDKRHEHLAADRVARSARRRGSPPRPRRPGSSPAAPSRSSRRRRRPTNG